MVNILFVKKITSERLSRDGIYSGKTGHIEIDEIYFMFARFFAI